MTHLGITLALSLVVLIVGILGIGGGKMWGERKVDEKIKALNDKMMAIHQACNEARVSTEKNLKECIESLEEVLAKQIQPRLIVGNFIMDALAEKVGVPKSQLDQIKSNVKNGTLKD